jgi:hypothetical protein
MRLLDQIYHKQTSFFTTVEDPNPEPQGSWTFAEVRSRLILDTDSGSALGQMVKLCGN